MRFDLKVKTAATSYPVTLAEVENMIAYDSTNPMHAREELFINSLISAAVAMLENYLGRAFMSQTLKLYVTPEITALHSIAGERYALQYAYELLSDPIKLWRPPCQSVSNIIAYDQVNTAHLQAPGNYTANINIEPATVNLSYGAVWEWYIAGYYAIEYIAGYTSAANVPIEIRNAILLTVAQWYKDREQMNFAIPPTATALVEHLKLSSWDL